MIIIFFISHNFSVSQLSVKYLYKRNFRIFFNRDSKSIYILPLCCFYIICLQCYCLFVLCPKHRSDSCGSYTLFCSCMAFLQSKSLFHFCSTYHLSEVCLGLPTWLGKKNSNILKHQNTHKN